MFKYQYTLHIGDWSCDGHNQSDKITFNCTYSDEEIDKAYLQAVKKSGISLTNYNKIKTGIHVILNEYEDSSITIEQMQKLIDIGIILENMPNVELNDWEEDSKKWSYIVHSDGCVELFLEMVRTQLPEFKYELHKLNILPHHMGYGCFNS